MTSDIVVLADAKAVAREAADRFVALARASIAANGRFRVALSGGSTPRALYELLVDQSIEWQRVHIFWSDERCVPPDQPESNYRLAYQTLLSKVNVIDQNIHRMKGELDPAQAALDYENELQQAFNVRPPLFPRFDLILLGLGPDAHTASLFPGTDAVHEQQRWVVAHHVEALPANRITLTPPILNHAIQILFLVAGIDKAAAVRSVLSPGPRDPDRFPAQVVDPIDGQVTWLIDQIAAQYVIDHLRFR